MTSQEKALISQNLRLLADKQTREANFYVIAADLNDIGYQIDQAAIDSEIQKDKDARSKQIVDLEVEVLKQSARAGSAENKVTELTQLLTDNSIPLP